MAECPVAGGFLGFRCPEALGEENGEIEAVDERDGVILEKGEAENGGRNFLRVKGVFWKSGDGISATGISDAAEVGV